MFNPLREICALYEPQSVHQISLKRSNTVLEAYSYSVGTEQGNLHVVYDDEQVNLFHPAQEPVLATSSTGQNSGKVSEKKK